VIDWIRVEVCEVEWGGGGGGGEEDTLGTLTHEGLTKIKVRMKLVKEEKTSCTTCILYAPNKG
jgi:hypothetical protein